MTLQDHLKLADLVLVDRAFWQVDDINAAGLLAGGGEHLLQQAEVKTVPRRKLEKSEGLLI